MAKICPICGYENVDEADYCENCGVKLDPKVKQGGNIIFFPLVINKDYEFKSIAITRDKVMVFYNPIISNPVREYVIVATIIGALISLPSFVSIGANVKGVVVLYVGILLPIAIAIVITNINGKRKLLEALTIFREPVQFLTDLPDFLVLDFEYSFDEIKSIDVSEGKAKFGNVEYPKVQFYFNRGFWKR